MTDAETPSSVYRVLFLLSNTWPYGPGEHFIRDEMPHLDAAFDRIIVYPVNQLPPDMPQTSAVPDGVEVYPHRGEMGLRQRLRAILAGRRVPEDAALREEKRTLAKGPVKRTVLAYVEGKSAAATEHIWDSLTRQGVASRIRRDAEAAGADSIRLVLYAYWYFVGARVALKLRDRLRHAPPEDLGGIPTKIYAVARGHGYDINADQNPGHYLPYRRIFPRELDRSFIISDAGRQILLEEAPDEGPKITVARLGTRDPFEGDPDGLARALRLPETRDDAATTRGETESPFHLVTCARVVPGKRLSLLVDALAILHRECDRRTIRRTFVWTHLGGGDGLADLARRAEEHLPAGSFRFAGELPPAEILDYYRREPTDLFVSVSASEGVPVSIMEALSFGIPALATDVGGTREIVVPGVNGTLLPSDPEPEEIAAYLMDAMGRSADVRRRLRRQSRRLWETRCRATENLGTFAEILAGFRPAQPEIPAKDAGAPVTTRPPADAAPLVEVIPRLYYGGAEILVKDLALRFRDAGYPVTLWVFYRAETLAPGDKAVQAAEDGMARTLRGAGVRLRFLNKRPGGDYLRTWRTLRRWAKEEKPRVIHMHLEEVSFHTSLALAMKRRRLVQTLHSSVVRRPRLLKTLFRWLNRRIVAISADTREILRQAKIVPPQAAYIPNGIDTRRFTADRDVRRPVRRIVIVGRLAEQKRPLSAVAAMARLKARWTEAGLDPAALPVLELVGEGELREAVEAKIEAEGLASNVRLPGVTDDIPGTLKDADLFSLSSAYEGLPIALMEAMASELPIAVTATRGSTDLIEDGVNGTVVPVDDPEALAGAWWDLIRDDALRARYQAALQRQKDRLDIARTAARYLELFEQLDAEDDA